MRRTTLTLIAVLAAVPALAAEPNEGDRAYSYCGAASTVAENAMINRQTNEPMSKVMKQWRNTRAFDTLPDKQADIVEGIVARAYEYDIRAGADLKMNVVRDYQNRIYKACLEGWGEL